MNQDGSSLVRRMRDCSQRAEESRLRGDALGYRQRVEEYLFLSRSCVRAAQPPRNKRPRILLLHERGSVAQVFREGLIDCAYAVQVDHVSSLGSFTFQYGRIDPLRPSLVVIASRLGVGEGLGALAYMRNHSGPVRTLSLVLSFYEGAEHEALALEAGASAYAMFPCSLSEFSELSQVIRAMIEMSVAQKAVEQG